MTLPVPKPGLVIGYSFLWASEHNRGREEGLKDRPCAIVFVRQIIDINCVVTVIPITHTPPSNPDEAVEIPSAIKTHLQLDEQKSWIVVTETNDFVWPGVDLRPVNRDQPDQFVYGILPPKFFNHVREKILQAHLKRKLSIIPRSE